MNASSEKFIIARESFFNKDYEKALKVSFEIVDLGQEDTTEYYEAKKIVALIHYSENRFEESYPIFLELKENNNNSESHYHLGLNLLQLGQIEKGIVEIEEGIRKYSMTPENIHQSIHYMRINSAEVLINQSQKKLALDRLEELSEVFCEYQILDETFLHMRGVPSFISFVELLQRCLDESNKKRIEKLVNKLGDRLGRDGLMLIELIFNNRKNVS